MTAQDKMQAVLDPYFQNIARATLCRNLSSIRVDSRLNYARALNQFGTTDDKAKAAELMNEVADIVRTDKSSPAQQNEKIRDLNVTSERPFPYVTQ